jgi:hypothetical protein
MMKVKETEAYLVQVVKQKEAVRVEEGAITLYEAFTAGNAILGALNPEELPDGAYEAGAKFMRADINRMAQKAVEFMVTLFDALDELPDSPTTAQIKKVKEAFEEARLPYLFTASLSRTAIADVDYEYITEMAIEAGREAEAAANAE